MPRLFKNVLVFLFASCILDLLSFSQHLRQVGVVGKFVEFFGPGVFSLSIADRATISNMCPEYGATVGFFPVDDASLTYLRQTGILTVSHCCIFLTCSFETFNVYLSTVQVVKKTN